MIPTHIITEKKFFKKLTQLPFIQKIYLYGSRARGDNLERSDIDIAIDCPQATESDWQKVLNILDEADTLLSIDCVRYDTLSQDNPLKKSIDREKIKLFVRDNYDTTKNTP